MNCHGEDNPYLLFFLHAEQYGIISSFFGPKLVSLPILEQWASRFDISPKLLLKLAIRCEKEPAI